MSLSATVILLCLFAPKIYIVLFNPSKNIPTKFKTTLTTQRSNANNHVDSLVVTTTNNQQRRLTPSDYVTEVTFCNSKSDGWGLASNDEIVQTDTGRNSMINGITTTIDSNDSTKPDETTDLLGVTSKQKLSVNSIRLSTLNSIASNENPWKRLSNVRYRIDGKDTKETSPTRLKSHTYEQHITFV